MIDVSSLPQVEILVIPAYILFILIEIVLIRMGAARGDYETRDASASLLVGLGSVVLGALTALSLGGLIAAVFFQAYEFRIMNIPVTLWTILAVFILDDLRFYWWHRFAHRMRWFWANHVVHHSSQHFNLTTALRQPWLGVVTGAFVLKLPLVLLGFHPAAVAFVTSVNLVYQFFIHTETVGRLPGWVEYIFNTPSHHRVHHGRNPRYIDANYAGVFIIWDRIFGTFVPELDRDPVKYGLVKNLGTFNPLRIASHEYVSLAADQMQPGLTLWDRFRYIFAPPGWSHDGSRDDSTRIKAAFVDRHPEEAGTPGLPAS